MSTVDTTVGPNGIPLVAGAIDAPIVDRTADQLLEYIGFWLEWGIGAKLATMLHPPVASAAPTAFRHTNAPSDVFLKQGQPALFAYWNGKSKVEEFSTVLSVRVRDFDVLYVFERVKDVEGVEMWSGLVPTVDALMVRAFTRRAHPEYRWSGGAMSAGSDVRFMFGWQRVEFLGGTPGFLQELVATNTRNLTTAAGRAGANKAQGGIQSGYPTYKAMVRIWEEVGVDTMIDPDDLTPDILATISTAEDGGPAVPILERVLQAPPDGSTRIQNTQD